MRRGGGAGEGEERGAGEEGWREKRSRGADHGRVRGELGRKKGARCGHVEEEREHGREKLKGEKKKRNKGEERG